LLFWVFVDPPVDCPINWYINPENPLITCRVTRIHDKINRPHWPPFPSGIRATYCAPCWLTCTVPEGCHETWHPDSVQPTEVFKHL
jgi:hypothetical protein